MAILNNFEKNIILEFNLLKNSFLDVDIKRNPTENWIPFELCLKYDDEIIIYDSTRGCTLSFYEISYLISKIEEIIGCVENYNDFTKFEFCSCEGYFQLYFYKTDEENEIYVEFWINLGTYTLGKKYGYDKGVRFVISLEELKMFEKSLKSQLNIVISEYQ